MQPVLIAGFYSYLLICASLIVSKYKIYFFNLVNYKKKFSKAPDSSSNWSSSIHFHVMYIVHYARL